MFDWLKGKTTPAPAQPAPPQPAPEVSLSWREKLKAGLAKTRQAVGLTRLFATKLDQDSLDALLRADERDELNRNPLPGSTRAITPPAWSIHRRPAEPDTPNPSAATEGLTPPRTAAQNSARTALDTLTPLVTAITLQEDCDDHTNPPRFTCDFCSDPN